MRRGNRPGYEIGGNDNGILESRFEWRSRLPPPPSNAEGNRNIDLTFGKWA